MTAVSGAVGLRLLVARLSGQRRADKSRVAAELGHAANTCRRCRRDERRQHEGAESAAHRCSRCRVPDQRAHGDDVGIGSEDRSSATGPIESDSSRST